MEQVLKKNIEWINHLDSLYIQNTDDKNNPSFYYYPDIQIETESNDIKLMYRKLKWKTQILFEDNFGRKAYLSDIDIINIIVNSKNEVFHVICDILMLYINKPITEDINFKINDEDFYYRSIIKRDYDQFKISILQNNTFETNADLTIKYIDLITLISLIINKEFLVDVSRGTDRTLRQAKKFLVLSQFYKEEKYVHELNKYGYDTNKSIEEVYYNNRNEKKLDLIFDTITL